MKKTVFKPYFTALIKSWDIPTIDKHITQLENDFAYNHEEDIDFPESSRGERMKEQIDIMIDTLKNRAYGRGHYAESVEDIETDYMKRRRLEKDY